MWRELATPLHPLTKSSPEQAEQDCICPPYECLLGKKERCQKPRVDLTADITADLEFEKPAPEALQQENFRKNCYIGSKIGCHCTTECEYDKLVSMTS